MNALWLENNKIDLRSVDQPRKPNEALVKIRKAGICSTDLELVKGYYPYTGILGHEFVGEVVSTPSPALPQIRNQDSESLVKDSIRIWGRVPKAGGGGTMR